MSNKKSAKEDHILSFADKQYNKTLESYKHVLKSYKDKIDSIVKLDGKTPIFLDTSVILSIYEISFIARDKIKQFLSTHKKRIVLSGQVQFEFVKNREKVINSFQEDVSEQLPKDFNTNVISKLASFITSNKNKLEDYSEIQTKLALLQSSASELLKDIQEKVNDKKGTAKSLLYEDVFLTTLSETVLLENLESDYIEIIKNQYKQLLPAYKSTVNEAYSLTSFPGCAEKGEKDDPTGDYVIYHEMMNYALSNNTDIIFLTNDTTKGDWIRKDGNPHLHYIENFYLNTGFIIFILNAERLFESLFETSFESLISEKPLTPYLLTKTELITFLDNFTFFKDLKSVELSDKLTSELYDNKIYSIQKLETKLKHVNILLPEILKHFPNLNKSGALRMSLDLLNDDYERTYVWSEASELKFLKLKENWNKNFPLMRDLL